MAAPDRVRAAIRSAAARLPDLFGPGCRLVVGFSGGQDSTCLLHALVRYAPHTELRAVHVDHALRAESASDARRVVDLAEGLGVPAEVVRVDVGAYRRGLKGWSVQQPARAARYQALAALAARDNA